MNKNIFLRGILQYLDYSYNTDNYLFQLDPQRRQFFSQFLFSYKLNPRTVLFIGYSDNYFGSSQYELTKKDQTFFMKLGYSWQL
jgi:hypothetical protein